eukprot:g1758.t1
MAGKRLLALLFFCTLTIALVSTLQPIGTYFILQHFEGGDGTLPPTQLWLLTAGFLLCPLLRAFCECTVMLWGKRIAQWWFEVLTCAIYEKSLKTSSTARMVAGTGYIVNLMSTDASTALERAVIHFFPVFIAFPQLVICVIVMANMIGLSILVPIGILIFMIPINIVIFLNIKKYFTGYVEAADYRIKLVNEFIQAIRVIKFYSWEEPLADQITDAREKELGKVLMHAYWTQMGMTTIFLMSPQILKTLTFITHYNLGGSFAPSTIFTVLQLFAAIREAFAKLPQALTQLTQTIAALQRIDNFMDLPIIEVNEEKYFWQSGKENPEGVVLSIQNLRAQWEMKGFESLKNDSLAWQSKEKKKKKTMKGATSEADIVPADDDNIGENDKNNKIGNIFELYIDELKVKKGELIGIVGSVGSGKSSFLMALLNEAQQTDGRIDGFGKISYAAQQPWILSRTLEENVIFGSEKDKERYDLTIKNCALQSDIEILPGGDQIIIGERGINLSGGQKARVSLARAVFSDGDLYLLDDPLASVDAHVGKHIMDKCVKGYLKKRKKTVLLVTNQLSALADNAVDRILVFKDGKICESGTYETLIKKDGEFVDIFRDALEDVRNKDEGKTKEKNITTKGNNIQMESDKSIENSEVKESALEKKLSKELAAEIATEGKELFTKETVEEGGINFGTIKFFVESIGYTWSFAMIFFSSAAMYMPMLGDTVLGLWTTDYITTFPNGTTPALANESVISVPNVTAYQHVTAMYRDRARTFMIMYGGAVLMGMTLQLTGAYLMARGRVKCARTLHSLLLKTLVYAPISFFDVTPIGRVLNRFTNDVSRIDMKLVLLMMFTVITSSMALSSMVAIVISSWSSIFLIVFVCIVFVTLYLHARTTAIQVGRLEAVKRTPIYSSFSEVLTGLSSLRAYSAESRFVQQAKKSINEAIIPYFIVRAAFPAFMILRLSSLGTLLCFFVLFMAIVLQSSVDVGFLGLALSYTMMLSQFLHMVIFTATETESQMNAVERVKEYIETVPQEQMLQVVDNDEKNGDDWLNAGRIQFKDVIVGYRDGADILKSISLDIPAGTKLGVCGRTASGKSTIFNAIFRIADIRSGSILIDDHDISALDLKKLRKQLCIIPQEPVLFIGDVRRNLDPFSTCTDEEIWNALSDVGLKNLIEGYPSGLQHIVSENGENFSFGQRQMICIARAILRKPKLLLIDEATASIDAKNDQLLQNMIRTRFKDCTVITIAHRLDSIISGDRILLLDRGKILEEGTCNELLDNENSQFRKLWEAQQKETQIVNN